MTRMAKRTGSKKSALSTTGKSARKPAKQPASKVVAKAKPKPKGKPAAKAAPVEERDLRHEFVQLVMKLGTEEAQHLLDRVVDVQTPASRSIR